MTNRQKGEVALKVGDESYTLVFDINALCEVEELLDLPIDNILTSLALPSNVQLRVVRGLLWGSLRRHHSGVDVFGAGDMLEQLGGPALALESLGEALQAAFPDPVETEGSRPRNGAAAGTGRRSSKPG